MLPLFVDGHWIYGGAARNKRIIARRGLDRICRDVAETATKMALNTLPARLGRKVTANDEKVDPMRRIRRTHVA